MVPGKKDEFEIVIKILNNFQEQFIMRLSWTGLQYSSLVTENSYSRVYEVKSRYQRPKPYSRR